MKVIVVIPSYMPAYRYGGPINSVYALRKEMIKQGVGITIYTTNIDGPGVLSVPLNAPVMDSGMDIWYFNFKSFSKNQKIREYTFSPELCKKLSREITKYDIVHNHSVFLFPTTISAYLARKNNIPYLITPHGIFLKELIKRKSKFLKTAYIKLFERRNFERAAAIHCLTEEEKNEIQTFNFDVKKYVVIPNGIDMDLFDKADNIDIYSEYPQLRGKQIILFLSRINWKKGLEDLIPAFGQVAKQHENAHLVIAGPDNEGYGTEVRSWISSRQLNERVLFTGMITGDKKASLIKQSALFVLPSYSEGFSMAILEAMACRKPVIITKACNFSDVAKSNAGIVINKDQAELTAALLRLLNSEDLMDEMGSNGRRLVKSRYSWSTIASDMIMQYEQIIKRKRDNRAQR